LCPRRARVFCPLVSRLAGHLDEDGRKIARLGQVLALLGGLVITALGLSLLQASLSAPAHPLL
jgi:hypothetical protein